MEISSSRRTALQTLIEFLEFLAANGSSHTINPSCEHEIENVIVLGYSYAISLQDQDQLVLAELFLTKLELLTQHISTRPLAWQSKLMVQTVICLHSVYVPLTSNFTG
jgi:hypothetical protein